MPDGTETDDLFLLFPQWQGSGPVPELRDAAENLRARLPSLPFRAVPVRTCPIAPQERGILGLSDIQGQQRSARALIQEAQPKRIFTLGGDCGVEPAPVSWLNHRYRGDLALVWLDAHGDLNTPESSPSGHFHGMPLRCLFGDGDPSWRFSVLRPAQVLLAGARELDAAESAFIQEVGLPRCLVTELEADPSAAARTVRQMGLGHVYVHLDMDVLDPSAFRPLKCPTAGGLRLETLRAVLGHLKAQCPIVGFSVLEFTTIREGRDLDGIRSLIEAAIGDWLPSALAKQPESR